ncbi:MAG: hypothetical protein V1698_01395, partial [bacterium]
MNKKYSPNELSTMEKWLSEFKALFPEAEADINLCLQGEEHHEYDLARRCFEAREDISKIPPIEEIELSGDENPNSIFDEFSQSPCDWELRNKLRAVLAQKASPLITHGILKRALKKIRAMSRCEFDHNDSKPMHFIGNIAFIAIDAMSYDKKDVYNFLKKLSDIYLKHKFLSQQKYSPFATDLEINMSCIATNLSSRRNRALFNCAVNFIMGGADYQIFNLVPFIRRDEDREIIVRLFQKSNPYLAVFALWQKKEKDTDLINEIVSEHLKNAEQKLPNFALLKSILVQELTSKCDVLEFLIGYLKKEEAKEYKRHLCSL